MENIHDVADDSGHFLISQQHQGQQSALEVVDLLTILHSVPHSGLGVASGDQRNLGGRDSFHCKVLNLLHAGIKCVFKQDMDGWRGSVLIDVTGHVLGGAGGG